MRKSSPPCGLSREVKFSRSDLATVAVPDVLALVKDGHYAGIDISPTMVEEAKRFSAEFLTSGRAEFHCAAAERTPFPDAMFDRAFSIGVIHFWPEPVVALSCAGC
jgi:ubiquinone/menaquinone biosynthesis C-methylase UbiE